MILLSYFGRYKQMYELRKIPNSLIELHAFYLLNNFTETCFRLDFMVAQIRRDLGSLRSCSASVLSLDNHNAVSDRVTYGHSVEFLERDI